MRGTAKAAQIPGIHDRGQDRHGGEARQRPVLDLRLQRVVCRVRAVAQAGIRDRRRDRLAACAALLRRRRGRARVQRIAEAALRYLGIAPTIDPHPPVLVARRGTPNEMPASAASSGHRRSSR